MPPADEEAQTGAGGPWLQMLRDLFPFTINGAILQDGPSTSAPTRRKSPWTFTSRIWMARFDNLGNIQDETRPLVSTVQASALVMDKPSSISKMTLDPASYRPTFPPGVRLLGLDVTKINDLLLTYGKFDFKRGWFDSLEADSKRGSLRAMLNRSSAI